MKEPSLHDKKLAELVGIILGDGCIGIYECKANDKIKVQHKLQITLSKAEKAYAYYIKDLFIELFDVEPIIKFRKNENALDILIFKKSVVLFFIEKVKLKLSPKKGRVIIPEIYTIPPFDKFVLRGYFDTDGCITLTNNNGILYPRIEFKVQSISLKNQFEVILKRMKFRFGVYQIGVERFRFQLNGKVQLQKWAREIGSKNENHIKKFSGGRI